MDILLQLILFVCNLLHKSEYIYIYIYIYMYIYIYIYIYNNSGKDELLSRLLKDG